MSRFELLVLAKALHEDVEGSKMMLHEITAIRGKMIDEVLFDQLARNEMKAMAKSKIDEEIAYAMYERVLEIIFENELNSDNVQAFFKENFAL